MRWLGIVLGGMMTATPAAALPREAVAVLPTELPAVAAGQPGLVAVVGERGRVVWCGAVGSADAARRTPLVPGQVMRYGSISKQFTAALVMKLVEEGRLGLDASLGSLAPDALPKAWHAATVRQLLNHTAGIPSYTAKPGWATPATLARATTTQALIDLTRDQPLDFVPGTDWRYSNSGYVILALLVERATGKPWYQALREKITGPLGLRSIRCGCEPGPATGAGYGFGIIPAPTFDMTIPSGAGALVGTVEDLSRWAFALHGGKVVSPQSYRAMTTPAVLPGGRDTGYGFGLVMGKVAGLRSIGHNGEIPGFRSESLFLPERGLFAAAIANSNAGPTSPETTARRLLAAAAGRPFPRFVAQPLDAASVARFAGRYRTPDGAVRTVAVANGRLTVTRDGAPPREAFAFAPGRYFYEATNLNWFALEEGPGGTRRMVLHPGGEPEGVVAVRVD